AQYLCKYLSGGIFSKSHRGVKILDFRKTILRSHPLDVRFVDFLQAAAECARFLLEQAATHVGGLFPLVKVDPVADFALGVRGFYEAEPVAARAVSFLRQDFDYIAAGNLVTQGHHLPIHFGADALVPHFGVNGISKIYRSCAGGKFKNAALWR